MKTIFNSNAMKNINWQTVVMVGLALTLGLNIIFGRTSLKEAKRLTKDLELRIDTLENVENKYLELQGKYVDLYDQFSSTRSQIANFKQKLSEISKANNTSVSNIRNELRGLIDAYDTVDLSIPSDTLELDSLRF